MADMPDEAWLDKYSGRDDEGYWISHDRDSHIWKRKTTPYIKRTPARANAEKMLEAFNATSLQYCLLACDHNEKNLEKAHTGRCLANRAIIAAAEGRGDGNG